MTAAQVATAVQEGQDVADTILETIEGLNPAVAVPAGAAQTILDLTAQLVQKALAAWSSASGQPITVESVQALLPNPAPLDPPDEPSAT